MPACRQATLWPFAQTSVWNTPIGSGAAYVPAGFSAPTATGMFVDEDVIITSPTAPQQAVYLNTVDWSGPASGRCMQVQSTQLFGGQLVPVPSTFSTDAYVGTEPNQSGAILLADGVTLLQTQPLMVCGAGGTVTSHYTWPNENIVTGDGIEGAHGGSSMSAFGGSIRVGELLPGAVIHHAFKMNILGSKYLYPSPAFRWPALTADSCSPGCYGGTNAQVQMGSLMALAPGFAVGSLQTGPAKILAQALIDYGAYIVDNAAWDVVALETEWGPNGRVTDEFQTAWGFPFVTSTLSTCTDESDLQCQWAQDVATLFTSLQVVSNNGSGSIGGGGTLRAPLAPAFCP
jgi:hypothetical protein